VGLKNMEEQNNKNNNSQKRKKLILGLVLIIIGTGIIFYLVFIGIYSDTRDDNASLGQVQDKSEENTVVMYFWSNGCQPCNEQKPIIKSGK
jgi:hypothetical protein